MWICKQMRNVNPVVGAAVPLVKQLRSLRDFLGLAPSALYRPFGPIEQRRANLDQLAPIDPYSKRDIVLNAKYVLGHGLLHGGPGVFCPGVQAARRDVSEAAPKCFHPMLGEPLLGNIT